MSEQHPSSTTTGEVERFRATNGRFMGIASVVVAVVVAVVGVVYHEDGFPLWLVVAALLFGVLAWSALLRPAVWASSEDLVLRSMLHTDTIPLASIDTVVVRQVLAVRVGSRRFVSPSIGHSYRQTRRGDKAPRPSPIESYPVFVEDRITHLADEARTREGIAKHTPAQEERSRDVHRGWAWPEIAALAVTVVALVLAAAL